jgi:glycosyltransferase involved in cell wall biosynthesis
MMEKPNSIALVSAGYPPNMFGGIDTQTYDLAHALSAEKVAVTVFCGGSLKSPTCIPENDYLTIYRLPMAEIPPRVVWFQLQNISFLKNKLSDYDIIHTQHSSGSVYGLLKRKVGKPWVVSFHDHQLRRFIIPFKLKPWNLSPMDIAYYVAGYPLFELLTKMELKWADHYVACGESGFLDYVRFSGMNLSKTTVIPNGIDLGKIFSILQSFKSKEEKDTEDFITIFTCGRLYASKGIHFLLKAMPLVLKRFKNVRVKIFGKGPMYTKLMDLIKILGLQEIVRLEGHVPYERLICELDKCTLAVFPSMVEVGPSLAVMEAMACKKTVVMFRYPFSTEVIDHLQTGFLVQPLDIRGLADAICLLIEDEKLRRNLGMKAYYKILEKHDIRKIVKKYIDVYLKCINNS